MPLGVPELIILGGLVVLPLALCLVAVWRLKLRSSRMGYASLGAYLAAAPRTDAEKRDAVNLALQGLVLCFLGVIFAPLVLVGLVPLFYGGRKLTFASLGLGLVDDGESRRR